MAAPQIHMPITQSQKRPIWCLAGSRFLHGPWQGVLHPQNCERQGYADSGKAEHEQTEPGSHCLCELGGDNPGQCDTDIAGELVEPTVNPRCSGRVMSSFAGCVIDQQEASKRRQFSRSW